MPARAKLLDASLIRVLILEDNPSDAELMADSLKRAGLDPKWERVETEHDFAARLTPEPDLILSDYALPHFSGLQALRLVRSRGLDVPFILVSGSIGEDIAIEAMREGADDYLLKDRMARLGQAVIQAMERVRLRKEKKQAEAAQLESEQRFRAIFDHAGIGITKRPIHDRTLPWVLANDHFCKLVGYTREELLKLSTADITPADEKERAVNDNERLLRGDIASYSREKQVVCKDGRRIWVVLTVASLPGPDGRPANIIATYQDITERKLQQQKIERLSRIRALSSGINAAIVRSTDRQTLFNEACRIAVEHGKFTMSWIGILDEAAQVVRPVARMGRDEGYLERLNLTMGPNNTGNLAMAVEAIGRHAPVVCNDIATDGRIRPWRAAALERGYRSSATFPLMLERRTVGVFVLYAPEPGFFDDEEMKLLTELAGNISFALEHIARQQKIEKLSRIRAVLSAVNSAIARTRDRNELFDEACRIVRDHGKFRMAWIATLDRATMTARPAAWVGLDDEYMRQARIPIWDEGPAAQGTTPRALRSKQTTWDNDFSANPDLGHIRRYALERGIRSAITLPLLVEGEAEGSFSLYAEEAGYFTGDEIKVLEEVASNISFALEHITRQQKIEKLSRVRAMSSAINSAIVRARSPQALFKEACRIAVEQGRLGSAWIGSLDSATLDITPVAWAGEGSEEMRTTKSTARDDPPRGQGAVSRAIRERRVVFNNDLAAQSFGGPRRDAVLKLGFRSMIALPLFDSDAAVGTLTLYARETGLFDEDEIALLTELASNVSFALEHMARQEKVEKLSRIRAVLGEINNAIVRVREPEALLREICRIATEHGKFEFVWVALLDHEKQQIRPVAWTGFSPEIAHAVTWESTGNPGVTLGEVILTRRPAVRNDIGAEPPVGILRQEAMKKGRHSTVCLPFVVDGKVVAAINLFAVGREYFDEDELALLKELAANVSLAMESTAQQVKIERLSRIRAVLGEINAAIVRIRDKQELFQEACRIAVEAGRFPFAWLGVYDRNAMRVTPVASAGADDGFLSSMRARWSADKKSPGGGGITARAISEKKAVVVNDVQNDPRISRKEEHLERNIHSVAMLPLLVSDEAVGVLALHASEAGFFDEDEMKLLSELAGDIAFALQTIGKQEKLDYLSYYDTLTGLPNRTLFIDRAGQQMRSRSGEPLMVALFLINLERFRNVNDMLGRHGGDDLLKLVARRLENAFNGRDYLARIGADGFGVVMRGVKDAAAIVNAVENRILTCFGEPFTIGGKELRVSARVGVALFPADGGDADTLFNNAEAALKKAKASGDPYLFYAAEMNAKAAQALSLETRLRKAVEALQFVLHYQPKINLASGAICGLEALIRWQDPESGLVPPGSFIPLLEETGLIRPVGRWALAQALAQHREWTARGCSVPRIAVNVSAIQLQQKDFVDTVVEVVKQAGDIPDALELEITESLLMKDVEGSILKLSVLRGLGIHIAMDDFGTGYSSLSYVARLPINTLKIDRAFITGMADNPQDMAIATTIIALAHSLNLRVVAEGVETEEQARLLTILKCDEAQGYLFSKPLPAVEIEPKLRAQAVNPPGDGTKSGGTARTKSSGASSTGPKRRRASRALG